MRLPGDECDRSGEANANAEGGKRREKAGWNRRWINWTGLNTIEHNWTDFDSKKSNPTESHTDKNEPALPLRLYLYPGYDGVVQIGQNQTP